MDEESQRDDFRQRGPGVYGTFDLEDAGSTWYRVDSIGRVRKIPDASESLLVPPHMRKKSVGGTQYVDSDTPWR